MASVMMTGRVDHLLLLIFSLAFCFGSLSAAPCYNYSWIEVPSASVLNTTLNVTISNASDCQMRCYNNLTCTGYALDKTIPNNTRCYFNFALTNSSNSGITYFRPDTNISYFSLLRDTPSCGLLDSNCSYMWKGQKDLHGFDGVDGNRSTLNGCVRLCQNTPNCTGVDWNQQDTNCWINFNNPVLTGNQPNITFFQRNCNDIPPATTKATTPGPTTTSTSTTTTTLPTTTITTSPTTTTTPTTPNTTPTTAPTTTPIGSSCDGISCPPGKSCQLNSTNQPECVCNPICTTEYAPVCGSDGKTYSNRCGLMVAACQTSNNITVANDGQCLNCSVVPCPPGKSCQLNWNGQPECLCNKVCTREYDPICGSDGKTYTNRCGLMVEACQTSNNITVAYAGVCQAGSSCDGISCPPGKSCQLNSTIQPECILCNTVCTQQNDPVCGSDGKTYANKCEFMVAACQTSNNITVAHDGQCRRGPTAPEAIKGDFETYPMAIKPAYIVLAGLGGGCIVLVITAVVILCVYPLHKNLKYSTNSTVTTVHTHQPHTADNNSYEADEQERIDMDDMAEGEVKTYYNAEEVN